MTNEKQDKKYKIGIYSPYLEVFGGGERYIFSLASLLSSHNEVFIFADKAITDKTKNLLNIDLNRVHFLPISQFCAQNFLSKYIFLNKFDIFFYMTDGSLFFSATRKNFLVIQSPAHIPSADFLNKLKLVNWRILCYSQFMHKIIYKKIGKKADILSPCIAEDKIKSTQTKKENIILTVGRFFLYPHSKKHEIMLKFFIKNYRKYFAGWKLVITGGLTEEGGRELIEKLKVESVGYPVDILVNPSFNDLQMLYQKAKIYWHATGFGEDLEEFPERAEHFGITTIEAMAKGAVPVVFKGGGQKEIVSNGVNGFLWDSEKDLIDKTYKLISDKELWQDYSNKAREKATFYSCQKFYAKLEKIIDR